MLKFVQLLIPCVLICFAQHTIAADVRYNVGSSIAHYDNINHDVSPADDEFSNSVYAGIEVIEENASFTSTSDAQIDAINYRNNVVEDETNLRLSTDNLWTINPGQFEWYVGNVFTQTAIDSLISDTPTNRQNINVFSTGPNYIIRINARNNLRLEARAENFNYEESADSNRLFIATRWGYDLNSTTRITANDEAITAKYNGDTISDYNRNDIYVGVEYIRGLNTFNAEYGLTRIDNENTTDFDGDRYLISFTNTRTRTSSIRFIYENILTDTGDRLIQNITSDALNNLDSEVSANDIFLEKSYRARYMKTLSSGELAFQVGVTNRNYEIQPHLDEKDKEAIINTVWNLKRTNRINFDINYINRTYQDPAFNRVDKDYEYSINYLHEFMRNVNFTIEVTSNERISTITNEAYEDVRYILSLNYTTL